MQIRHKKAYYRLNSKRIHLVLYILPLIIPVLFILARCSYERGVKEHLYDNEQINGIVLDVHYQEIGVTHYASEALLIELDDGITCAVPRSYFDLFKRDRADFLGSVTPDSEISLIINQYRKMGIWRTKPRVMQIIYNDVCYLSIDDVLEYEQRETSLWNNITPFLISIVFVIILEWCMHQFIVGCHKLEKSWREQREQFFRRHGG